MSNIIREVGDPDFRFYFDGDMFSATAGDYGYTLFIVTSEYYYGTKYNSYLNKDEFENVSANCNLVLTEVYDKIAGYNDYYKSIKDIMEDFDLPYNPKNAKLLKDLANGEDFDSPDTLSVYLSIKTGKKWETYDSRGCCQGDYATIIYCPDFYKEEYIEEISDIFWGLGKEFAVKYDGEDDFVYGYYIADCQYRSKEDIKTYFCKMDGLDENNTVLEVITGSHTVVNYDYETI